MTKIESVRLTENNTIEVVCRESSNMMLLCDPPRPVADKVWKDTYGVLDGQIKLLETKQGRIQHKTVEEKITFE